MLLIILTSKKLEWKYLSPDLSGFLALFDQPYLPLSTPLATFQARLVDGMMQLFHSYSLSWLMLLRV